ncbi:TetR/AcrR family transcriptional regulator [Pseudomonas aeruginosa]|uniref:TetR/AcrR family transcriptional regulator n=1 Tax=Pseudomonas aeruginosa TaxID=287 RepID=UPI0035C66CFD
MDTLMKAAGLTTGAFYSQFSSKAELLEAILQRELSAQHDAFPLDSLEQLAGHPSLPQSRSCAACRHGLPDSGAGRRGGPGRARGAGNLRTRPGTAATAAGRTDGRREPGLGAHLPVGRRGASRACPGERGGARQGPGCGAGACAGPAFGERSGFAASGPGLIAQLQCSASSVRLSLRQVSP